MRRPTTNRLTLGLLGLLLLVGGVAALLAGLDLAPWPAVRLSDPATLWLDVQDLTATQPDLTIPVVVAIGVLLLLIGLRVALAEVRPGRQWRRARSDLELTPDAPTRTIVSGSALSNALADDLLRIFDVVDAEVTTWEQDDAPRVAIVLGLARGVGIERVRPQVERSLDRFEHALGQPAAHTSVRVDVRHEESPRVR